MCANVPDDECSTGGPSSPKMSATPWAAVVAIARAQLRRRWRALAALGLLAGLVGAVVVTTAVSARRTGTAYERLEESVHVDDARVSVYGGAELADQVASLPLVRRAWVAGLGVGRPAGDNVAYFGVLSGPPRADDLFSPLVVAGRAYDQDAPDEVVVAERFSQAVGIGVGDVLALRFITPEEFRQFDVGFGEPDGPAVDLRVTGVVRFGSEDSMAPVFASPAFAARHGAETTVAHQVLVHLHGGPRAIPALDAELERLSREAAPPPQGGEEFAPLEVSYPSAARSGVEATAGVIVTGLGIVGLAAGAAGLLAVALVFGRYQESTASDQAVERALGLTLGARVLAYTVPTAMAATVAALATFAGGLVAGVVEPIGAVRRYEPHPGWAPNVATAAAGAFITGVVVVCVAAVAARRAYGRSEVRPPLRPNPVVARAAALGARPTLLVGLRLALEPGRGRTAVPVRSALIGASLGMAGVVAVGTFGASLDRLLTTPTRYGWPGDFTIADVTEPVVDDLVGDPRLSSVSVLETSTVRLGGRQTTGITVSVRSGSPAWALLDGTLPAGPDQVALGTRLARRLGTGVGDDVEMVDREGRSHMVRVVGVGLWPRLTDGEMGVSVALTEEGMARYGLNEPFRQAVVDVSGADPQAVVDEYGRDLEVEAQEPPVEVANLGQLRELELPVGIFLATIGVVALGHTVTVAVRRRARDVAVLRALGLTSRQAAATLATMALTTAVVGLAVGTPVGLSVGNTAWKAVARGIGVADDALVPAGLLVSAAPAAVAAALLAASVAIRRASRLQPSAVLRSE
jgi:putative ABC transport system permease protein